MLRHAVPIIAPHLLAAPARSAHQREGPWSGQKSVDPGRRRGFARAEDARFPRRVFATGTALAGRSPWAARALDELAEFEHARLVLEGGSVPPWVREHLPDERIERGEPSGDPFGELTLLAGGEVRVGPVSGALRELGLEAFWAAGPLRRVRAERLNREAEGRAA
ncbi:MAG: hypothetical protein AAFZ65_19300 [Planctomycetota bacterium]